MGGLLREALVDSAAVVPFLLAIYLLVEWFERRFGAGIERSLGGRARYGPALGALFGCIPQCGFSVVASTLYARGLISRGTLLAVFLATSDEAIPVILAQPAQGQVVAALLVTKLVIGMAAGYAVDVVSGSGEDRAPGMPGGQTGGAGEHGCCEHDVLGTSGPWLRLKHPLIHTAKVFLFVLAATLGIGALIGIAGDNLATLLLRRSLAQPCLAALFGLIPNCAASVAIATLFLRGGLSYGAAVAGLCSSAGLGLLVLLRESHDRCDTGRVILLLVAISAAAGVAIQAIFG